MNSLIGRRLSVVVALITTTLLGVAPIASADHGGDPGTVATGANPAFPQVCGIDVGIALDTSNSIIGDSAANPGIMKDAAKAFVDALTGTPSRVAVYSFQTNATLELGITEVSTQAGANAVKAAIDGVVFGNGSPTGGTNWEAGFLVTQGQGLDALAFATDGNPTTHNGDGDAGTPPGEPEDLHAGIVAANGSKAQGTRIIGVGIGAALNEANLKLITGPTVGDDYYLPASFAAFQATLQEIANRLCAPSVTVQNLVDDGTGTFLPQPGWVYTPASTVGITANPADGTTLADGQVNFKLDSAADIDLVQTTKPGFVLQSVTCQLTNGGAVTTVDISDGVTLTLGVDDIAVCEFRNVAQAAGLSVDKVADTAIAQVGDTITYTYTVTNTGNATIDNLALTDDKLGTVDLAATTLAAGASTTGTATHVVTAADLAGPLTNIATATGTDPGGNPVTGTDDESVDLAAFAVTKVADVTLAQVGDVVTYTYTVINTGSVALSDLKITDDKLGAITLATTDLAVGVSTTGTAKHTVTAADLAAGVLANVATGTAKDPGGTPVTAPPVTETVDLAGITLVKTVGSTSATVGDTLTYTYVVKNVGTVTLTNITLADDKIGTVTLPGTSLAPGASMTATATYVVTAADAASPPLINIGTVAATDPSGKPVGAKDDAEVPTIVLQTATTTTTTTTTTTVAGTLPKTGGQVEAGPASSLGVSFMMLGGLLVLAGLSRRRQLAVPVRQVSQAARDWAQRHLRG